MNNPFENPNASVYEKLGIYEKPFELIPDYRFSYFTKKRIVVFDKIMELIKSRANNILITGDSGSGKTSLARRIEFKLNLCQNHYPMFIDINRKLHSDEFWKMLVKHFYLRISERPEKNQKTLVDFLETNLGIVKFDLIIDNAEKSNYALENTLLELEEFQKNRIKLFQMIYFKTTQEAPKNNNNKWPNFRLERFDLSETRKMIEFRLCVSGSPQLFSKSAKERIFDLSNGNPSKVVYLCKASLDYVSQNGKTFIDEDDIEGVKRLITN